MMWQRVLSPDVGEIDPEHERELRLVAQARAGAAWALSALVARYQPPVVRYLVRLTGSAERGRALAEDVLVRMAKRVRGPHGGDHLRLWLLRTSTEVGLDALRHPQHADPRRLGEASGPVALIAGRVGDTPVGRWVAGWGTRMRQQAEPRPPVRTQQFIWQVSAETPAMEGEEHDQLTPLEALKYRMVRAVLAELPYGDAQCLSLHLVAGLNQTEVAQALGIAPAVARRRIVQGLQLFGRRYEAALASLGLSPNFDTTGEDTGAPDGALPAGTTGTGAMAASASGVLDAPGVIDADAVTAKVDPVSAPAVTSITTLELPVGQLTPPAVAHVGAESSAPEVVEAEERALTSAAIMAYLRTAAANARPHQQVPTIVEAATVVAPPDTAIEHAGPTDAGERRDFASASREAGREPEKADQGDSLVIVEHDAPTLETDERPNTDTLGAATRRESVPAHPSLNEVTDEAADEMTSAAPRRAPRLVPVFIPADKIELVPRARDTTDQAASGDAAEDTLPPSADGEIQVAALADATIPDVSRGGADDATSAPALSGVATSLSADEESAVASDAPSSATIAAAVVEPAGTDDADHSILVVEAEPEPPPEESRLRFLRARRTQVLSADGEAEDPTDAAIWPVT